MHTLPAIESHEDLTIYRTPCYKVLGGRLPFIRPNRAWRKSKRKLSAEKIDHVIVQTHLYSLSLFGARFASKRNLPTIIIEHGSGHVVVENKLVSFFEQIYEHIMVFFIKRLHVAFYGVSQKSAHWLNHFGVTARGVIYNAIDVEELQKAAETNTNDLRETYAITHETTIVAFVSRLVQGKGLQELIDVVNKLVDSGKHLFLVIAGDGELYESIVPQQNNHIVALGNVDHPFIPSLLAQSDIYCLPTSLTEGFPTTVLEAAASKCFCITTTMGGSEELISSKEYGIILQDATRVKLEEALLYAIEQPEYRKRAVIAAHKKVCEQFTWSASAEAVQKAFELDKPEAANCSSA